MSTGTLWFTLLAGALSATAVWWAVRLLCARLAGQGKNHPPSSAPKVAPEEERTDSPEAIAAVYRQVFVRRLGGLLLCLTALAVWLAGAHWLATAALAGAGCILQYLAYRLRSCYALRITAQRQHAAVQGLARMPTRDSGSKTSRPEYMNTHLSNESSSELTHR